MTVFQQPVSTTRGANTDGSLREDWGRHKSKSQIQKGLSGERHPNLCQRWQRNNYMAEGHGNPRITPWEEAKLLVKTAVELFRTRKVS
ncbi:hypothetical protein C0J52_25066 [Blattella germanica]|nr:hypothetical protein C0J52_25066 [Blattella germanica]